MEKIYQAPSFYAHIANGLLLFLSFIVIFVYYTQIQNTDFTIRLILILLISISIGIHGLMHLGLEKVYGYNPISFLFTLK
jgi:hypothetical protein